MPKTSGSGNSKHAPASGIPAKGAAILHPGYRPASGRPRMTPEARARGWETIVAMTPADKAERRAMREAQAETMLDHIADLAVAAEHEMTRLNAARGFRHEVLGLPVQRNVNVDLTNLDDLSDERLAIIAGGSGAEASAPEGDQA
jgi:hypothetical protein